MKTRRYFSVFLLVALLISLFASPPAAALDSMDVAAKAALLVDEKTGTVLYAKNEHQELYPASLTKIMTALLVLDAVDSGKLSLDQEITASASAFDGLADDGSTAGIKPGETLTVQELLDCMLVVSANEACAILAEAVSGSVSDFVDAMNAEAQELGCKHTHFVNPTGLHDPQHYTSAWDLYLNTKEALTHKEFLPICDSAEVTIPATNLSAQRTLHTTNYLLSSFRAVGYVDKEAQGIKTGSTSEAGHCLVSTATRGSLSLISVVLGAQAVTLENGKTQVQSFSETSRLFDWGFDNFSYQTVLKKDDVLSEVPVSLSREVSYVTVHPQSDVELLLPNDVKPEDLEKTVTLTNPTAEAPIAAGDPLGEVSLSYQGTTYATVPLLALNDVAASRILVLWHNIQLFFSRTIVKIAAIALGALIVVLLLWKLTVGRRRYRAGRSVRRRSGYRGRRR